jgi:hypothetical protein
LAVNQIFDLTTGNPDVLESSIVKFRKAIVSFSEFKKISDQAAKTHGKNPFSNGAVE